MRHGPQTSSAAARWAVAATWAAASACGGHPEPAAADAGPSPFIADQGDFSGFTTWESFDGGTEAMDNLAVEGQRTIYLNQRPPHGSIQFPQGTIIVKTTAGAPTFGMAKRGGEFNATGALGWEWFQLASDGGTDVQIVWRGAGPPVMFTYSTGGTCNSCHFSGYFNDFVEGSALQLSQF